MNAPPAPAHCASPGFGVRPPRPVAVASPMRGGLEQPGRRLPWAVSSVARSAQQPGQDDEASTTFSAEAFHVSVAGGQADAGSPFRSDWRSNYVPGRLLGDGISAMVYEAEGIKQPGSGSEDCALDLQGCVQNAQRCQLEQFGFLLGNCGSSSSRPRREEPAERGRRVAIKRFHRAGTKTFQSELLALHRVGVHPNVLRLLESYQGHGGEDVLVLEYCDGTTLYDLYAQEHSRGGIPERLTAKFIKQLLLALEHLRSCGIEHQDVKPENMMLFDVSVLDLEGQLKLGDFGWAEVAPGPGASWNGMRRKQVQTGVGSLWYAPPELNPPVDGLPVPAGADLSMDSAAGRSDMWSVGVVLYLLLVGTSPFNMARQKPSASSVDQEVLRLTALGDFNRHTERWHNLNEEARHLISALLCVQPTRRLSALEALRHPFIVRRTGRGAASHLPRSVAPQAGGQQAWGSLDGLQRLGWLAVARAIAEPELDSDVMSRAFQEAGSVGGAPYLWHLARQLGTSPVERWLRAPQAFDEVVRLAFCYLDLDDDGLLSPQDLVSHVARASGGDASQKGRHQRHGNGPARREGSASALVMACRWIARWQAPGDAQTLTDRGCTGLQLAGFREALLASQQLDDRKVTDASHHKGAAGHGAAHQNSGGRRPWAHHTEPHCDDEIIGTLVKL